MKKREVKAGLEERVARLEKIVAELQQRQLPQQSRPVWLDLISGRYKPDDPFFKAMKLGSKYRKSLRPRPRKSKSKG